MKPSQILVTTLKNAGVDTDLLFYNPGKPDLRQRCVKCKLPVNDIHKHYEKAHPETARALGFTGERR